MSKSGEKFLNILERMVFPFISLALYLKDETKLKILDPVIIKIVYQQLTCVY